mmetsp:Transcript_9506/g.11357  ORF Transcript_9506/g.11357 Transcript_9506/m.11357 type:complete len:211 (-) Transcript_9506:170-802(-)|eukprot:jgi/Bigna1/86191/estExt_fgenesh1_pg.C_80288
MSQAKSRMNEANKARVEKWKQQKIAEWERGGKLRDKCATKEELDEWMEGQINKAQKKLFAPKTKKPRVVATLQDDDPEVTWEDQQRINSYGRLDQRMMELEDAIKAARKSVQENEDAAQDIEGLLDDDACKIKVGEVYVQVSNDDAEDFVRDKQKEAKENLESLLGEKSKLVTEMETLKVILKGKYGNKINLDSRGDDEDHLVPEEKASR